MNMEFTGRQVEITPDLRKQAETALKKLSRVIGDNFECKVILTLEKHRHLAELTVSSPNRRPIVGIGEARDMASAMDGALNHIERQLLKNKARWRNLRRQQKDKGWAPETSL